MSQPLHPKLTLRFYTDQKCFGPGVAALLLGVEEHHSLRSAAGAMEMAYSKAWKILRQAEAGLGIKLLTSTTGGKGGGGAALTPEGKALLDSYLAYVNEVETFSRERFEAHFTPMIQIQNNDQERNCQC